MRRREILKSAVALATTSLSANLAASAAESDAETLLHHVAQSYASMSSYEDSGAVKRIRSDDSSYQTDFSTLYKRPSLFRFEFSRPHPYPPLRHLVARHVVGFDGSVAYSMDEGYQKDPTLNIRESIDMAIAGATGISSGSAHTIGSLLLGNTTGPSILDLLDARFNEDAAIGGIACYCIAARHPSGCQMEYLIEKDLLLIRRVRTHFEKFPTEESRENIRIDQPLDDGLFAMEVRDAQAGAHRPGVATTSVTNRRLPE